MQKKSTTKLITNPKIPNQLNPNQFINRHMVVCRSAKAGLEK